MMMQRDKEEPWGSEMETGRSGGAQGVMGAGHETMGRVQGYKEDPRGQWNEGKKW